VVEHLSSKHEAQSLNLSIAKLINLISSIENGVKKVMQDEKNVSSPQAFH
jgi:hypothetical protein